ncbi:hypothetical protein CSQ89_00350 [Chitinimonas sp. BJB300]|nr:hypothetical protein CSQ89_00350 [Chitinimonas sp. BJB300]
MVKQIGTIVFVKSVGGGAAPTSTARPYKYQDLGYALLGKPLLQGNLVVTMAERPDNAGLRI